MCKPTNRTVGLKALLSLTAALLPVAVSLAESIPDCPESPSCWSRSSVIGDAGAKEIKISLTGLDADVDLFVRKGLESVSTTEFDCSPALPGTRDEVCVVPLSGGETANIGVLGAPGSSFSLDSSAVEDRPNGVPIPLILGQLTPGRVTTAQPILYQFDSSTLPELSNDFLLPSVENFNGLGVEFIVELKNQSNDADVLMQVGSEECSGNANAGPQDEICAIPLISVIDSDTGLGRPILITVLADPDDATTIVGYDVRLQLQKTIDVLPSAISLVPETPNSSNVFEFSGRTTKGTWNYYQINPEKLASTPKITVLLTPAANADPTKGDVDLYMRDQAPPSLLTHVCFGDQGGTAVEECVFTSDNYSNEDGVSPVYIGVYGVTTSNFTLKVTLQ